MALHQVGQSWSSSVWTTLRAFWFCIAEVHAFRPQLVLCNGPGACANVCALPSRALTSIY